jgi:2-polyprenyl-6-hydroxyphenyl methylase/3-demethylubiquinone-9 3-methyltransferase
MLQVTPGNEPIICKMCGGQTRLFGSVDFNRSCEHRGAEPSDPAGLAIPYHRCTSCHLLFTVAFDHWSGADFLRHIYNDGYLAADPDYVTTRPTNHAQMVLGEFGGLAISLLDYGGGNGRFCEELARKGLHGGQTYDPFSAAHNTRPTEQFDLITCFETLEHLPDPKAVVQDIAGYLKGGGMVFFSTMIQPRDIQTLGTRWWYIGPRNGHITLYSAEALGRLWASVGLRCVSFNENYHAAFRQPPPWAESTLRKAARELTPAGRVSPELAFGPGMR